MSSGVAGSNFWIPIYLLGLGLEPRVAFWCSLLTMLFGFGSGTFRNWRAGTIDGNLVRTHAPWMLTAAALGALLAPRVAVQPLLIGYSLFVTLYGLYLGASTFKKAEPAAVAEDSVARWRATAAGALHGLIATGGGSLMMPGLLQRRPQKPADAVGSTVLLVFLSSLVAAACRIDGVLYRALTMNAELIASMMLFAAPGVVIGGQLGPRVAARLPALWLRRWVALILVTVGLLVARRALG